MFRYRPLLILVALYSLSFKLPRAFAEPYCGIYSVCACANSLGKDYDVSGLLRPDFIADTNGSTTSQILAACEELRLSSVAVEGLGPLDLHASFSPCILHVRATRNSPLFNHWVVFLGTVGGTAKVYDPNFGIVFLELAELGSRWDGIAVVVGDSPLVVKVQYCLLASFRFMVFGIAISISAFFVHWIRKSLGNRLAHKVAFGVLSVITFTMTFHAVDRLAIGAARDLSSLRAIYSLHNPNDVSVISLDELKKLANTTGEIGISFIDARPKASFEVEHIPGALNIPVDCSANTEARILASLNKHNHLVVYCSNELCNWADLVAQRLANYGFSRVSIYRKGLLGWQENLHSSPRAGYLGIVFQDDSTALIKSVAFDSPAYAAGIQAGDKVLAINARQIGASSDAIEYVRSFCPREPMVIEVLRSDAELRFALELGEQPSQSGVFQ